MMNRQLRRAQEKQDKRAEREKEKRKDARRAKIQQARQRREQRREEIKQARASGQKPPPEPQMANAKPRRKPGRFSGALMIATVFFIVLQSAVPPDEAAGDDLLRTITSAGFYLLFGYFSIMWLMRRDTPRPLLMTLISGFMLTLGVEVAKRIQGDIATDWLMLALAVPGLVAGAFLGRLVYVNTPG